MITAIRHSFPSHFEFQLDSGSVFIASFSPSIKNALSEASGLVVDSKAKCIDAFDIINEELGNDNWMEILKASKGSDGYRNFQFGSFK